MQIKRKEIIGNLSAKKKANTNIESTIINSIEEQNNQYEKMADLKSPSCNQKIIHKSDVSCNMLEDKM